MIPIAEHTVDLSLLPEKANILDLGCRGFLFTETLRGFGHNVVAVDADCIAGGQYYQMAITSCNGYVGLLKQANDPQATRVTTGLSGGNLIPSMTLQSFSEMVGVKFWDVIKIDIEGSEHEVIMSLKEPPAKQLSIEFHLHTKIYGEDQVREMEIKLLSLGYYPVKHDKYPAHGCTANYWDSLWILT
jgi:hypothetical protein